MDDATIRAFREAFDSFDQNKDGKLDEKELHGVLTAIGVKSTGAELRELLSMMDKDEDGAIDFEEFVAAMSTKIKSINAEEFVEIAYEVFDRDEDGAIGIGDLRSVYDDIARDLNVTDKEIREIVNFYGNRGGALSKAQFTRWMNNP